MHQRRVQQEKEPNFPSSNSKPTNCKLEKNFALHLSVLLATHHPESIWMDASRWRSIRRRRTVARLRWRGSTEAAIRWEWRWAVRSRAGTRSKARFEYWWRKSWRSVGRERRWTIHTHRAWRWRASHEARRGRAIGHESRWRRSVWTAEARRSTKWRTRPTITWRGTKAWSGWSSWTTREST